MRQKKVGKQLNMSTEYQVGEVFDGFQEKCRLWFSMILKTGWF